MCRHVGQAEGGRDSVPQSAWRRGCLGSGSANRPAGCHFVLPVANVSRPTLRSLAVFWVNLWLHRPRFSPRVEACPSGAQRCACRSGQAEGNVIICESFQEGFRRLRPGWPEFCQGPGGVIVWVVAAQCAGQGGWLFKLVVKAISQVHAGQPPGDG